MTDDRRAALRAGVVGHTEWVDLVRVDHVPAPGEIVGATPWWSGPGGGGAAAVVQMLKLTGDATFFTALGDDAPADETRSHLEAVGVRVEAARRRGPSRRAFTHVDRDGERTITVIGDRLQPHGADPLPWDRLPTFDAVYFTAGDASALGHARRGRVLTATSRAMSVVASSGIELDALVGSARDASEHYEPGMVDPPPRLVVMTDGENGGKYWGRDGKVHHWAAASLPAAISDRYGAGDSFAACLTVALAAGLHAEDAIQVAACGAAAVIGGRGPYDGQAGAKELFG